MVNNKTFVIPFINNIHECRRYLMSLSRDHDASIRRVDFTSISSMNYRIKTNIHLISNTEENKAESIYKSLKMEYNSESITEDDFGSLLTDIRVNFYAWLFLNLDIETNKIKISHYFPETQLQASNKKERADYILSVFDGWFVKKEIKLKKIDDIKKAFSAKFIEFKSPLKWLNQKNKEQCQWAFDYTINYLNKLPSVYLSPTNNIPHPWLKYIAPISSSESRDCTIAAFDYWPTSFEMKKIFLININKAWNQQKYRRGIKNKKALNTFIDEKSKEKLDWLSEKNNMKLNQMIEHLIDKEFNVNGE